MRILDQAELAAVSGGGNPMKKLARMASRSLVSGARMDGQADEMTGSVVYQTPRQAMLQHLDLP